MLTRRNIIRAGLKGLAGLAVLTMTFAAAQAQSWPSQNIRLVVPFPPGGSTDVLARKLAEGLRERLGQTVVVENRGGAGGTIGSEFVAKSAPDGYTLLMGVTGSHGVAPSLYPNLGYQPERDFAAISLLVSAPLVLVVNPEVPAKTLKDFIALAKTQPDTLTYGTPGNGTSMHLTGVTFDLQAGTKLVHVPYKGSAGALTDLLSGQIKTMFGDLLVVLPQIRAGKINALAVTSKTRNPLLPDVPTMAEAGLPGFEVLSWQGLFAPAGTPPAVVDRLGKEVRAVMESKDVKEFFAAQGFLVGASTPAEFTGFVGSEVKRWSEIVKAGNVRPN
jgi:tripartite-type tricarboxylate transporter receptor subunit TctC